MADDKGKSYRNLLDAAASKGMEMLEKNRKYTPTRETDQHILDRMLENVPGRRPGTDRIVLAPIAPAQGGGRGATPLDFAINTYMHDMYPDLKSEFIGNPFRLSNRAKAARQLQKDLDIVNHPDNKTYHTNRKEWDEAVKRLRKASKQVNSIWSAGPYSWDASLPMSAADKQYVQDLQNEVVASRTAPGAQKDRPGRIQEIVEGLNITEPDSAIRAFVREMKRRAIDDRVPRAMYGYKTEPGEDFMRRELEKRELIDTPRARAGILKSRGLQSLPKTLPVLDESGNRVPRYVDEMKAAREKAAEKAYQRSRKNPMQVGPDTPERD